MEENETEKASHHCVVHTPGPWEVVEYGWEQGADTNFKGSVNAVSSGYEDRPTRIASAGMFGISGRSVNEAAANAKLIAASPELFDLVVRCYRAIHRDEWEDGETESELMDRISDTMHSHFGETWRSLVE